MIRIFWGAECQSTKDKLLLAMKNDLAAGNRVLLLVPEQETVARERLMLRALSPTVQLCFEVSNFTRLANRVFRTIGGLSYKYATPAVHSLFMWKTLRTLAPMLQQYGKHAANDRAFCDRMLSAATQCKAYCVTPEQLTQVSENLPVDDPLKNKLLDIGMILAAYWGELSNNFDDMADDISRATDLIASHKSIFADTHIYIDSFTDFTAQELRLIRVLMESACTVNITSPLMSANDTGIHLASAAATYHKLFCAAKENGQRVFYETAIPEKPHTALEFLRHNLFVMNADPAPRMFVNNNDITITAALNAYTEAEYVATTIRRLVLSGCRYRDITVILRDVAAYSGIIDAALEKEDIPFFISEKSDITVRPLIKLILFALRIKQYNWQKEDVVGYLKTGLCGIAPDDVNFFEEYAEVWRLRGEKTYTSPFTMNPDGYAERISARGERILAGANRAREIFVPPLLDLFATLDNAADTTAMCKALYRFLESIHIPEKLKQQATSRLLSGERREAEEISRLWNVVVDALESISDTIGEDTSDIAAFCDALHLVFDNTDIGTIPTSADEVMIGSAATLRAERTPYVFIIGLNEGLFPLAVSDKGILSDAEKRRLATMGIELDADSATASSDELFYLYRAVSLPTKRLFLSYTQTASNDKPAMPSITIARIEKLFHGQKTGFFDALPVTDKIYSRAGGIEYFGQLEGEAQRALRDLLTRDELLQKKIDNISIPITQKTASVPPQTAEKLFGPHAFNPTGIEKFVSCKFAYYCSKVLRLREEPTDALDAAAVGTFVHYVLENAFRSFEQTKKSFADHTNKDIEHLVATAVADYRQHLVESGGGITPRAEALLKRLCTLARIVLSSLFEEFADSDFSPAFLELDLTANGEHADIRLPEGTEIPLSGKADRVDYYQAENGDVYLRIADYKTGKKDFRLEDIKEGTGLQMPLYLFALCKGNHPRLAKKLGLAPETSFKPAGFTYFSTAVGVENTTARVPFETALQSAADRLTRKGVLPAEENLLNAISKSANPAIVGNPKKKIKNNLSEEGFSILFDDLVKTVGRISGEMKSGAADIAPRIKHNQSPCNFCAFSAICRAAKKTNF